MFVPFHWGWAAINRLTAPRSNRRRCPNSKSARKNAKVMVGIDRYDNKRDSPDWQRYAAHVD